VCGDTQRISTVATLDIYDSNESATKNGPQNASAVSYARPKLPRGCDISPAFGLHGHTDTWIFHGG
jgi:hypothetical protein